MGSNLAQSEWHVAGDGAIGMALAYRLHHHQSATVTLLTRTHQPDFVDLLYEPFGEPVVKWSCPTNFQHDGKKKFRRLVIATKAYSVEKVLQKWSPSLEEGATVYFLQNGIGFNVEGLPDSARSLFVANGGFTAYLAGRRHVVQSAMKPIWIGVENGDPSPSSPDLENDLQTLDAAGFQVRWTPDIVQHRWEKISINAIVNTQAVIYDCVNGRLLEHPQASVDIRTMCDELGSLFKAMSVDIASEHLHKMTLSVLEITSKNICSTLQDYRKGMKRHELEYINLALLKEARSRGIEMPVHEEVYLRVTELFDQNSED